MLKHAQLVGNRMHVSLDPYSHLGLVSLAADGTGCSLQSCQPAASWYFTCTFQSDVGTGTDGEATEGNVDSFPLTIYVPV